MRDFNYEAFKTASWDNDILNLVAQIHEFKGRSMQMPPLKDNVREKMLTSAMLDSVESSNRIEGITTTPQRLRQLAASAAKPRSDAERHILGYKDAVDTINRSYQMIGTIRPENIAQLHMTLFSYDANTVGGQYKQRDNAIVQVMRDGSSVVLFQPPPFYETPELIERLCCAEGSALDDGDVDPLILIPAFILDFLCIHPFPDGNGRMSRLLTSLLLHMTGYDIDWYISLDKCIEHTRARYYQSLAASNAKWHDGTTDYTTFIKYLLGCISMAYRLYFEMFAPLPTAPLSPFKPLAIDLVRAAVNKKESRFTKTELMRELPTIGKSSIENALTVMVEEGSIYRHGAARGTYYTKEDAKNGETMG